MPRARMEKEEGEKHLGLLKLMQILSFLVVFVAGVVIGLATTSHISRYFTSQTELYSLINHFSVPTTRVEDNCTGSDICERRDCSSFQMFIHPDNLTHAMSDDELFWRASMVSKKENYYPFKRVPKVAFMFLTRGPLPMLPLWERFFSGHDKLFSIYVHALPGYELNVSSSSVFYRRQIPSQRVSWGTVSLADAERRLLANALLDFSNERFVLLSESCIPVYNFQTVYKYLTNSAHSFVESYDEPTRYGRGRYSRKMLPDIKLQHWRKGSQWFELSRALAVYIVADTKYYTLFKKFCKPACYPDEHYIPTYLNMFHGSLNSNRTVTWVDWSMGGPHPFSSIHSSNNSVTSENRRPRVREHRVASDRRSRIKITSTNQGLNTIVKVKTRPHKSGCGIRKTRSIGITLWGWVVVATKCMERWFNTKTALSTASFGSSFFGRGKGK